MAAVHGVACNSQIADSRERRVLLDGRTRHVLPYLDELARSLDSQYDEFTRYISLRQEYSSDGSSIKPYICRRCFLECKKGLKHDKKARESRAAVTAHLSSCVPKRLVSCLSDYSDTDDVAVGSSPNLPGTEHAQPSARRTLFVLQVENSSPAVTVG